MRANRAMTIRVNDKPRSIVEPALLAHLLGDLGVSERRGMAVAVNDTVVPRAAWPSHALADGDRVLVIQATQGG
jgi:sulfur carrier protein